MFTGYHPPAALDQVSGPFLGLFLNTKLINEP